MILLADQLSYKGKAITRVGNELYYGNPQDSHVVFMQILSTEKVDGVEVPGKVHVQLLINDPSMPPRARIVRESDKNGLYNALDIGGIWLRRALSEK